MEMEEEFSEDKQKHPRPRFQTDTGASAAFCWPEPVMWPSPDEKIGEIEFTA